MRSSTLMNSFHGFLWILLVTCIFISQYSCLLTTFLWKQNNLVSNLVCPDQATSIIYTTRMADCGSRCAREADCLSFIYVPTTGALNCYLMNTELYSTLSCVTAADAKYYTEAVVNTFSCHPDDGMYHNHTLSDGTVFTYRIVHSLVDAATAHEDCELSGGFLVKLSTLAKLEFIQHLMNNCSGFGITYYHLGGSNTNAANYSAANAWTWDDGEPVDMTSTFWYPDRPNAAEIDHCLVLEGWDGVWQLNDDHCSKLRNFICEKII